MTSVRRHFVDTNGVRLQVAEQGSGPLVVLLHGFPESWWSWRHQLGPLAEAGYRVVAPDQRGYGESDAPEAVEDYTVLHLVGDVVGLLDALGEETAVVVGHDWGAPVAWHCALLRPDRFRAVAALSVAHMRRPPAPPLSIIEAIAGDSFHYILYFQEPGVAEAELAADTRSTLRRFLWSASGDIPIADIRWNGRPKGSTFMSGVVEPPALPAWLTEADLDAYESTFARHGFRGGLNWYRNIDRNWALTAAFEGRRIEQPALFVAGTRDGVVTANPGAVERLGDLVPGLVRTVMLDGCGHWTQQERPAEVTAALLEFLRELDA